MHAHFLGALVLVLTAYPTLASAAGPTVAITSPANGAVLGDSFPVSGTLQSTYTVNSVQAQTQGGAVQALTLSAMTYYGTISAASVPVGPMVLTVTATDSLAATGTASVSLIHDHPPAISVATQSGFVARPDIRLQATCTDLDMYGCASISVSIGTTVIASTNGPVLDTTVSLLQYDTQGVTLTFTATDTQGMTASLSRWGNVATTLAQPVVARGDGPILSFDATRILFATDTSLVIRPRGGGADTVVGTGTVTTAYLTSHGAIWPGGEWRDGVPLTNTATSNLVANGDYAGWTTIGDTNIVGNGNVGAYWRNVATGTTTRIATDGYDAYGPNVASNGDMVFTWIPPNGGYQRVYRYRGGTLSEIPGSCVRCEGGVTDGVNVAYVQLYLSPMARGKTYLYAASGAEIVLDSVPMWGSGAPPGPTASYTVSGGWTAFTRLVGPQAGVVYTRSPDGTIAQASLFNADTYVAGLSDTGDVLYSANGSLYLGRAGGGVPAPFDCKGGVVYQGGSWYGMFGQLLVLCAGGSGGDGGPGDAAGPVNTSDASTADASTSDASSAGTSSSDGDVADSFAADAGQAKAPSTDESGVNTASPLGDGSAMDGSAGSTASDAGGKGTSSGVGVGGGGGGCSTSSGASDGLLVFVLTLGVGLGVTRRRRRKDIAL